jgi:hypothetical protein
MFIPNENRERWEKYYGIQSKTKNSQQTFNYLIKLVLNFELSFSMKFAIIYIHICMYIYLTKGKNEHFLKIKMVLGWV